MVSDANRIVDCHGDMNPLLRTDPHEIFPHGLWLMPCNFCILAVMECHRQYGYAWVQLDHLENAPLERQSLGNTAGCALGENDENPVCTGIRNNLNESESLLCRITVQEYASD